MADCRQIALPYIEDHSENVAQMRVQTNPGIPDSESLPADLAQELERLRYAVARHAGVPYWYSAANAFNVKAPEYGATGLGIADDTAAIESALSAANAAGGGIVFFPPGTYLVSKDATYRYSLLLYSNIVIAGAGPGLSKIKFSTPNVNAAIFYGADLNNITIRDIALDNNHAQGTFNGDSLGLALYGVNGCRILNNHFLNIGNAAMRIASHFNNTHMPNGTRRPDDVLIDGNLIEDYSGDGINFKFNGCSNLRISNNLLRRGAVSGIKLDGQENGITGSGSWGINRAVVQGNIIQDLDAPTRSGAANACWGIAVEERSYEVVVTGNVIEDINGSTVAAGVLATTAPSQTDTPIGRITISDNVIRDYDTAIGNANGILVETGSTQDVSDVVVTGNIISDPDASGTHDGITLRAETTGYTIKDVVVANNTVSAGRYGIFTDTADPVENVVVAGNVISNTRQNGIHMLCDFCVINSNAINTPGTDTGATDGNRTGIAILAVSDYNDISHNVISNPARRGISLSGNSNNILGNTVIDSGNYGIYITSGADNVISLNYLRDTGVNSMEYGLRGPSNTRLMNNMILNAQIAAIFDGIDNYNAGTIDTSGNRTA